MQDLTWQELVAAIALHLGEEWSYSFPFPKDSGSLRCDLKGPGCAELWLIPAGGRINVLAKSPYSALHRERGFQACENDRITLATERGPAAIAKAIRSRILPSYLPGLVSACKAREEYDRGVMKARNWVVYLAAIIGGETRVPEQRFSRYLGAEIKVDGEVMMSETVSLKFYDVPVRLAEQILKLIKEEESK